MKTLYTSAIALLILLTTACETKPAYDRALFEGAWNCVAMYTDGKQDPNPQTIIFDFKLDSTYNYTGGSYTETGKWWLEGDKLVTVAEKSEKKVVKVEMISIDSLILKMNDRGNDVRLVLLPK